MTGIPGAHIDDWDERRTQDEKKLDEALVAIPAAVVRKALEAYEDAPPGTGRHNRMCLAIYAIQRKQKARNGEPA